ncbi:MAG TPA: hypothetical protein VFX21_12630 [Acidimicrobiia bacterium]|nr:hypothetical protein [Acidimicrobiia bacterium]
MKQQRSAMAGIAAGVGALTLMLTACGGGGGGGGSASAFCKDYMSLASISSTDPDVYDKVADKFEQLADEAPSDIKDELETMSEAANGTADGNLFAVDSDEAGAAADRADAWVTEHCTDN